MFIIGLTEAERKTLLENVSCSYEVLVDGYKDSMTPELKREKNQLKSVIVRLLKTKKEIKNAVEFFNKWGDSITTKLRV